MKRQMPSYIENEMRAIGNEGKNVLQFANLSDWGKFSYAKRDHHCHHCSVLYSPWKRFCLCNLTSSHRINIVNSKNENERFWCWFFTFLPCTMCSIAVCAVAVPPSVRIGALLPATNCRLILIPDLKKIFVCYSRCRPLRQDCLGTMKAYWTGFLSSFTCSFR